MSYFNHAFNKAFYGSGSPVTTNTTADLSTGDYGFANPKTWNMVDASALTTGQPLYFVAGSLRNVDQIGPFAGGYTESVKSKLINPKYITRAYRVDAANPQNMQITVGSNTVAVPTSGETPADWCNLNSGSVVNRTFACNSTYNLRVDIKGSPVLRFLTRNTYYTAAAYTGCCPEGVDGIGSEVNPLLVYIQWAYQLLNSPLISPFIKVDITYTTDYTAGVWSKIGDGTASTANLETLLAYINDPSTIPAVENWDTVSAGVVVPGLGRAGLIIEGAYVDTEFGTCTFYPNDSIIAKLEPVKIYASEVDLNGDPCAFGGVCVHNQCAAQQGTGFGESAVRDLIMSEAYMQQPLYTGLDLRIREILKGGKNGSDALDAIANIDTYGYTRYYIQHSVPRLNNPTSTFDNEQYMIELIMPAANTAFEDALVAWLAAAGNDNYNPDGLPLTAQNLPYVDKYTACTPIPAID